jgi:hypothetical protein
MAYDPHMMQQMQMMQMGYYGMIPSGSYGYDMYYNPIMYGGMYSMQQPSSRREKRREASPPDEKSRREKAFNDQRGRVSYDDLENDRRSHRRHEKRYKRDY